MNNEVNLDDLMKASEELGVEKYKTRLINAAFRRGDDLTKNIVLSLIEELDAEDSE